MSTLSQVVAFLAAWLGLGLIIAPFVGGMLSERSKQQYPFRRKLP